MTLTPFLPRFPTRPVRPIRWTYSSMSLGRSKLITCFTLEMSRPLAATWVHKWNKKYAEQELNGCTQQWCRLIFISNTINILMKSDIFPVHFNSHRCGHQNGAFSWSELAQGLLTVSLGTVTMDTGASIPLSIQEVLQGISTFLGLHKNQSQRVLPYRTENMNLMLNMTSTTHFMFILTFMYL